MLFHGLLVRTDHVTGRIGGSFGLHQAGRDRVRPDAFGTTFDCESTGHREHGPLARSMRDPSRSTTHPFGNGRGEVDDRSLPLLLQQRPGVVAGEEDQVHFPVTSRPAASRRAPKWPPSAPAPTIRKRIARPVSNPPRKNPKPAMSQSSPWAAGSRSESVAAARLRGAAIAASARPPSRGARNSRRKPRCAQNRTWEAQQDLAHFNLSSSMRREVQ